MKRIYLIGISYITLLAAGCNAHYDNDAAFKQKQNEITVLSSMLAQKPDSTGLRLIVANKLDSIGEYKNALLQIDTLIHADSSKYGLWMAKANVLLDSGNTDEAKYYLRKTIAVFPGNEAVMSLSEILAGEKNDSCLSLIKLFSDQTGAYAGYIAALYAYKNNDPQKADSLLDKSIQYNRDFVKPYVLKGTIFLQKNEVQKALSTFKEGLKTEPGNIALLNNTANAYNKLQQPDSAKMYYTKSLMAQPFQPKISEQLKTLK